MSISFSASEGAPSADVLLISMPFGPMHTPSIGLSLIKASLEANGISTQIRYFSVDYARIIGVRDYDLLSGGNASPEDLIGEWIFAGEVFDCAHLDEQGYVENVLMNVSRSMFELGADSSGTDRGEHPHLARVAALRQFSKEFIDWCLHEVLSKRPRAVGFSSVFWQHLASMALAKRIRAAAPHIKIVFGGANCEGIMGAELVRSMPFIDVVVAGEGDEVAPRVFKALLAEEPCPAIRGVYTRDNAQSAFDKKEFPNTALVFDLNVLPPPRFDDFMGQFQNAGLEREIAPKLLFETSRGCWWGAKQHCTFCGLNGTSMAYRSKSQDRALSELEELLNQHNGVDICVVDNILDMAYFKDFIPRLAEKNLSIELFYETKANLRRDQVRLLRDAKIARIQPGIESFSSSVLKLMRKGVSGLQNIQLLKWCKEFGIHPLWNYLWGFPGECPEEYERIARKIPFLSHLQPPIGSSTIRLDRFSPNYTQSELMGFTQIKPYPAYSFVYPFSVEIVANFAYYFTFEYSKPQNPVDYTRSLFKAIDAWRICFEDSDLLFLEKDEVRLVFDFRPAALKPLTVFSGAQKIILEACDQICSEREIRACLSTHYGREVLHEDMLNEIHPLLESGLVIEEDTKYLGLGIAFEEYAPSAKIAAKIFDVLRTQSTAPLLCVA